MFRKQWLLMLSILLGVVFVVGSVRAMTSTGQASTPINDSTIAQSEESGESIPDQRQTARRAIIWLVRTHQNDDGGYSAFSSGANLAPSTVGGTVDAILAIASAGFNPTALFPGETMTPVAYLEAHATDVATFAETDGAQAGKLILALTAASVEPRDVGGFNAVQALVDAYQPDGSYGVADVFKQSLAVLALVSVNEPVPVDALEWIVAAQAANGSWEDGFGTVDNPDATSMAVMALRATGTPADDPALMAARDFLMSVQLPDASWEYGAGFGGNANSTALVIQALSALGEVWHVDAAPWTRDGTNPLEALLSFQSATGAFQADFGQGPFDDFFSTVQVLPAVSGRALPLQARLEAARMGLTCLEALQDKTSGGWEQFAGVGVNAAGTSRAMEAIRAGGGNPQDGRWITSGGASPVEHVEAATPDYLSGGRGGRVGIVMQGVTAAGAPYTVDSFAGLDLPLTMTGYLSPTGEYDSTAFGVSAHAEAMLGLIASEEPVDPRAIEFLVSAQDSGDWGEADQNGIALQVLGRLGQPVPKGALEVMHATQLSDAGWGFNLDTNPSATSEVAQGLVALDQNPYGPSWSTIVDGRLNNPADAVINGQGLDGCWPNEFGPGADTFSTTDAVVMLGLRAPWDVTFIHLPVLSGGE